MELVECQSMHDDNYIIKPHNKVINDEYLTNHLSKLLFEDLKKFFNLVISGWIIRRTDMNNYDRMLCTALNVFLYGVNIDFNSCYVDALKKISKSCM